MSNERNFRVSINLCLWFNDHRHKAKIFITDNINTIGDLEKRIENIFKIKNFHLTSQNEYLPSSEDIRVLQKDDIVWVMQSSYGQETAPKTTRVAVSNTEEIFKNKKRMLSATDDYIQQDTHPAKKKKKKKYNQEKIEDIEHPNSPEEKPKKKKKRKDKDNGNCTTKDQEHITTQVKDVTPKEKSIKKALSSSSTDYAIPNTLEEDLCAENENNSIKISKLLPVLQSHIKSYNKKISNRITESESTTSVGSPSSPFVTVDHNSKSYKDGKEPYKCKGKLSSYKKKVSIPTITDKYLQEKKVNIVKIEYLSGGPPHRKELELTKNNEAVKHESETSSRNTDTDIQNLILDAPEKNSTDLESRMDQNIEKEEGNADQNTNSSAYESTDIKFIPMNNKNDDTYFSPMSNSLVTTEKMETCTNETEAALQIKNDSLNNTMSKKEYEIVDSEVNKPLLTNSSKTLNITQLDEADKYSCTTQCLPVIGKYSLLQAAINDSVKLQISKSVAPLVKIDISSKEENKNFVLNPYGKISDNCPKVSPSSEELVKNVQSEVENTNLESGIDVSTGNDSVCNQSVNNLTECSSNKLQDTDSSDLIHFTNKTDVLNENISLASQKTSTNNQNVNEMIVNTSGNGKDSDTDLTEDLLRSSSDTSLLSRQNSSFSRRKQLAGIGQLLGELREQVTGESMDSDHSEFITKRKRKRVRKRKKKNNPVDDNTSLDDSSIAVNSDYVPKPIRSRACPTLHLKFEEEDGEHVKVVDITKKENRSVGDTESYLETSGVENITIDSDADQSHCENFSVKEEYILKSPSIKSLLPKVGDIIAFKILRITENYTPEISPYIIGKVIEFNSENKIVLYEILNGLDHCKKPKGILTLDEADENDSNKREFAWADIIDPRLLFP